MTFHVTAVSKMFVFSYYVSVYYDTLFQDIGVQMLRQCAL